MTPYTVSMTFSRGGGGGGIVTGRARVTAASPTSAADTAMRQIRGRLEAETGIRHYLVGVGSVRRARRSTGNT